MIGTKFNYYDLSAITEIEDIQVDEDTAPVVLACGATAKGTEQLVEIAGNDYRAMFGAPSFVKYGQASIQNQRIAAAGAKLVFQRLVADDATLANIVISAKLYQTSFQRVNAAGELLYLDAGGNETNEAIDSSTGVDNTPIMDEMCNVMYKAQSVANVKDIKAVVDAMESSLNSEGVEEVVGVDPTTDTDIMATVYTYPLIAIADNGRGVSSKRFSISPENSLSKNLSFMYYSLNVIEDGDVSDKIRFSAIPDKIYSGNCIDLNTARSGLTQVSAQMMEENMTAFMEKVCELSGLEYDAYLKEDILFGTTRKGTTSLAGLNVDTTNGIQLNFSTGIGLVNGSDGSFTDAPAKNAKELMNLKALEFYNGSLTDEIYNLDTYQIDACFDADLPVSVKEKIVELAEYRKDFMYYRDYGTEIYTFEDVENYKNNLAGSTYVTDFCQTYDVKDPYSLKNVTVTIIYSISAMIIKHITERRHCPFAGKRYSAVITDIADKNTLRFAPKILPDRNEKDDMEDIRVNFASYFKNDFVVESLYTSQDEYTQLSFSNNVMAVQQVIKALRVKFPAIRYQFITKESDLEAYEAEVNECLSLYAGNFAELRYQYIQDIQYIENKIFRAAIYFRFNEFVQGELIDAYMLPTQLVAATS